MSAITSGSAGRQGSQPCASHPLAQLAISFASGILFGPYLAASLPLLISVAAFTTLIAVLAHAKRRLGLATAFVSLAMFVSGSTFASIDKKMPANQLRRLLDNGSVVVGEPVELTGMLEREPEVAADRFYLQLRVEKIRSGGVGGSATERDVNGVVTLLAVVPSESIKQEFAELDLRYGARLRVMTQLERTDSFRNPGVSPFTEYLDREGYDATAFVKSPLLIERLENQRVFLPLAYVY